MDRVQTGIRILDAALAGGLTPGSALLLSGEEGAGATEFALSLLRHSMAGKAARRTRFLSALRSPTRVRAECATLFETSSSTSAVEVLPFDAAKARAAPGVVLEGLAAGDIVVIESANALAPPGDGYTVTPFWREVADKAGERGITVLLLHSPGTLPSSVEAQLAEAADGVLRFGWHDTGASRRRTLALVKLRGLAAALDGGEVPLFEVTLRRGVGFDLSRGTSVL